MENSTRTSYRNYRHITTHTHIHTPTHIRNAISQQPSLLTLKSQRSRDVESRNIILIISRALLLVRRDREGKSGLGVVNRVTFANAEVCVEFRTFLRRNCHRAASLFVICKALFIMTAFPLLSGVALLRKCSHIAKIHSRIAITLSVLYVFAVQKRVCVTASTINRAFAAT